MLPFSESRIEYVYSIFLKVLMFWCLSGLVLLSFQAAQRIKTPAKYVIGTSTIPFNPSAFGEVNTIFIDDKVIYFISLGK